MSSLAQDELGHAAALYGLLAGLTGARRRCDRLRPRAGRLPARPPARPRPRRLGDDDRPALPVRDGRRGPPRGAGRRAPGRRWPSWSASSVREERYHAMHVAIVARPAGPGRRRAARAGWSTPSTTLAPDAATVFTPLPGEPALVAAGILAAPMARARGALARRRSRRRFERLGLPMPPAAACADRRPRRPRRARSAGCGASSRASAAATPERPGERGRRPTPRSPGRARAWARPAALRRRRSPSARRSPRSRIRSSRCSRSSTSGSSARRGLAPTPIEVEILPDLRRLPGARRHPRRRSPSAWRAFGRPVRVGLDVRGALDLGAHHAGRPGGPRARPGSPRPVDRLATLRCPFCASAAGRDGQPVRTDPVPLALLLPGLPPAVRSHQAGLSGGGADRASVGVVGAGTMGAGHRPGRARGRPRGRALRRRSDAAIERPASAIRDGLARRAARLDLDADAIDDWVDGPARTAAARARRSTTSPATSTSSSRPPSRTSQLKRDDLPGARRGCADPTTILATNTSALSVAAIAARDAAARAASLGLHFFNPAPLMAPGRGRRCAGHVRPAIVERAMR